MIIEQITEDRKEMEKYLRDNIKNTKKLANEFCKVLGNNYTDIDICNASDAIECLVRNMLILSSQYRTCDELRRIENRMIQEKNQ